AYIRVSSIDQNEQRQIEEMKKFGAEKIFIENNLERRLVIGRFSRKL
ncbi:TPA: recombinase family protein, partial [Enterococcus faecium]|nr:recombinase family protein [Enterococcus faecium]